MRKNLRTTVDGEKIKEQHFVNTLHRKILKGMHNGLHPLLTTSTMLHLNSDQFIQENVRLFLSEETTKLLSNMITEKVERVNNDQFHGPLPFLTP